MRSHAVLIIAGDPLASALLGAAVEQAGSLPYFPHRGESARAALRRVRPRLVLVSCDHEDGCSDAFVGPALMTGAEVLVIETRQASAETRATIERLELPVVDLSRDAEALARRLRTVDE